jgi:CRP-like cAMP-binding protein
MLPAGAGLATPPLPTHPAAAHAGAVDPELWRQLFGASPLSSAELAALRELARVEQARVGATLFADGDAARDVVALVSGDVSLGRRDAQGHFRAERNLRGPAWLDASAAWLGRPHALAAQAVSNVRIVRIGLVALQARMAADPALARHFLTGLAAQLEALSAAHRELVHKDAAARLAGWLLRQASDRASEFRLHHRKRDVATELAITPETMSRLMGRFARDGLINVSGYAVHLLDRRALVELSGDQ